MANAKSDSRGDLTVTALYTAETWRWGGFGEAELLASKRGRDVFNATNLALGAARLLRPRLPSLRHSLVLRHAMIDHLVARSGCRQVLELAAGLSRRGAAMTADPELRYVEVNLPAVIAEKERLLRRSEHGAEVADRPNLQRVAGDVRDVNLTSLVDDGPLFVVAEGLLMYLPADEQRALWRRLAALLTDRPGSALAFDLVPFCEQPKPGAVGRGLGWLFGRFTRGGSFAFDQRTRANLSTDLRACGFAEVEIFDPAEIAELAVQAAGHPTQALVWLTRTGAPPAGISTGSPES